MGLQIRAVFEPLRTLAFGSIGGAFTPVGTPIAFPARMAIIQNLTNAQLTFTFDLLNAPSGQFVLPAGGQIIIDFTANHNISMQFYLAQGSQLYVEESSAAPTSGSVYFSVIYGAQ